MNTASSESLVLFNRQLAAMVGMDLPLPESLRRVGADLQDPALAKTVAELAAEVERGSSFAEAVDKHKASLPEVYGALVKAGEAGGGLSETLRRAAAYEEQMLALGSKLRAALIYPALLFVGLGALLVLFATFVIPRMAALLPYLVGGFGDSLKLPLVTSLLVGLGSVLGHWLTYVLLAPAGYAAWRYRARIAAELSDRQLRVPLWRDFVIAVLLARFCKTLGELLARGVGQTEAFTLAGRTMGQRAFEAAAAQAAASVEKGGKVGESLAATGLFPSAATWLLGAAEERGDLVSCLDELGDHYHRVAERRARTLAALIEPAACIVMGLVVAFVLIGFFKPIFDIGGMF